MHELRSSSSLAKQLFLRLQGLVALALPQLLKAIANYDFVQTLQLGLRELAFEPRKSVIKLTLAFQTNSFCNKPSQ